MLRLGGFDIDFVTDEGSALHVAAMFGQVDAVKYLTEEGKFMIVDLLKAIAIGVSP